MLDTSICGMLACSLAIDKYGWLGAEKKRIGVIQHVGMLCVVAGIAVATLSIAEF